MRLIDADEIYFRCAYNGDCMASHEQCLKCSDYVVDAESIQDQPTAYNVEEVVAELEKQKCITVVDDEFSYQEDFFIDIDDAIKIVCEGGVDNG